MDEDNPAPLYKRILLKISGEALQGENGFGISQPVIERIAKEVSDIHSIGIQIAIVIGGGNFFRGINVKSFPISRSSADYMGMLATVMNGIALCSALEHIGLPVRHVSALNITKIAESFVRERINRHLGKSRIVIFSAGTGNPYFTTDTAAALRAIEIGADIFLKATMVDGIYSNDPKKDKSAQKFARISYEDVIARDLKVLDHTAVILCRDNNLPIKIMNMNKKGNILASLSRDDVGSLIN